VGVFGANETVFLTSGTALVLVCNTSFRDSIIFPTWSGPPHALVYNDKSGLFNPNLGEKLNRLNWTNNNIDLQLDPVTINDAGLYTCDDMFQKRPFFYDIEVNVIGKFKYVSTLNLHQTTSSVP